MKVRPEYTEDLKGYQHYQTGKHEKSTDQKYTPIIAAFERQRNGMPWSDVSDDVIEFVFLPGMERDYRDRYGKDPSSNTVRGWHDALRSYFDYLVRIRAIRFNRAIESNPMKLIAKPSYRVEAIKALTPFEDAAIERCFKNDLEQIVVALAREAGLRAAEIRDLNDDDIDFDEGVIHICAGKTRASVRDVTIVLTLAGKITTYRRARKKLGIVSPRFVVTRSGSISSTYIWQVVKRVAARAEVGLHFDTKDKQGNPIGLDKDGVNVSSVSPHTLRRTYGMDYLDRNVSLPIVSDLLGHAHQRVTEEAYARPIANKRNREALYAAESGSYSAARAVDGMEARLVELNELPKTDPAAIQARLRTLADEVALALRLAELAA